LQQAETTKLHYNKYLYKLETRLYIAHILRTEIQHGKNFQYARREINAFKARTIPGQKTFQVNARFGQTHLSIDTDELLDVERIIANLMHEEDYTIRVEQSFLNIYSNNESLIDRLAKTLSANHIKVWKPNPDMIEYLQKNKNVIIVNKEVEFDYKVTFGGNSVNPLMANWIVKNPNLCKCGPKLLEKIKNKKWIKGQYVYIKNDKALTLFQLLSGGNISRIDKLIYKHDLDK